jgi:hypothetical protein
MFRFSPQTHKQIRQFYTTAMFFPLKMYTLAGFELESSVPEADAMQQRQADSARCLY